jgi:hypothetical protein
MIKPAGIPRFIGDWGQLAKDVSGLRSDAIGIRNGGADVHSRFQMLGAYYTAPEADDLFATTQPVMDEADTFAAHLETVADALDTFAAEARPLAEKLKTLREDAFKFVADVEGDDDWTDDEDKVARNNALWADVIAAESAFRAAERRAAGKISAIVGGPKYIEDDGSHKATEQTVMYGYDADVLKQAEELPWGSPVSETTAPGDIKGHLKNFLYDGFAVDGAGATLKGLGALVGIGGSAKEAWGNLGDAAMGAGYYLVTPLDWAMDQTMFADQDTETMKRQKAAAREVGKAMVAWDQWEEHPVQAAGTTTFNVLTLGAGPLGALARGGSVAGKAGLGAKAAGIGAKIGTYADPLSAGLTVGGKAVSKLPTVAEVTSRIRARAGATAGIQRVHSTLEFQGTRVRVEDGEFIRLNAEGNPIRDAAPHERAAADRTTPATAPSPRAADLVGAGARTPGATAHAGENLPPRASHGSTNGGPSDAASGLGRDHQGAAAEQPGNTQHSSLADGNGAHDAGQGAGGTHDRTSSDHSHDNPSATREPTATRDPNDHGEFGNENWGTYNGEPVHFAEAPDLKAVTTYQQIRESTEDVSKISENTGIDPGVIAKAKENLFLNRHDVQVGPDTVRKNVYFTAYDEVAHLWVNAERGTLKPIEEGAFRGLIVHEYVEAHLLKAGLPYRSAHKDAWAGNYDMPKELLGAHDIAPIAFRGAPITIDGTLKLWKKFGLTPPEAAILDDLSNLDEVVDAAKKGMGLQ